VHDRERGVVADGSHVTQVIAMRSSSAITARNHSARGGGWDSSAASTARANTHEYATVLSPDTRAASRAAASIDLPHSSFSIALVRVAQGVLRAVPPFPRLP